MGAQLVFGLDLGINNVGWSAVAKQDGKVEILAVGTYVFDSPLADENKPSEGLKSKMRGMFRRARRTTRRRRQRKMELYRILAEHGFLPSAMKERVELFCKNKDESTGDEIHPYALRAKALNAPLSAYELGRAICHLNQKRGFISPRDVMAQGRFKTTKDFDEEANDEAKGLKGEIQQTAEAMKEFPTIGAFLFNRLKHGEPVRKKQIKGAKPAEQKAEDQRRFVRADRHMIDKEFWAIMKAQSPHHPLLTDAFQRRLHEIVFRQRILAADKSTRGKCTFFKDELRIPRASLTAQKFTISQDVAHLLVIPSPGQDAVPLAPEQRGKLVAALMQGDSLTWNHVKELLGLPPTAIFNMEPAKYKITVDGREKTVTQRSGTKDKLRGSQTVDRIRALLGDKWNGLGTEAQRHLIGEIISIRDWVGDRHKEPAAVRRRNLFLSKEYGPQKVKFSEQEANELATIPLPEGYLSLSLKAIKKIMPKLLSTTMTYDKACQAVGIDHANPEGELPTLDRLPFPTEQDISHPIVLASVRGAVRILNSLHSKFGKPDAIHIELPRDLAMGAKQREEVEKRQNENRRDRERITKELVASRYRPTTLNIRKVQLWEELGGSALPYEPDVIIPNLAALMSEDYEIDHIIPRGYSFDNSMSNLTLCTREFNTQVKGNKTLYEALGHTQEWPRIQAHVKAIRNMPLHKRNRILAKERPEDFAGRHLAATGYISKEVLRLAQRMVDKKEQVTVAPGRATSDLRKFWQLDDLIPLHPDEKAAVDAWKGFLDEVEAGTMSLDNVPKPPANKNRSNFKHHALDATVVALTDRGTLKAVTDYHQLEDTNSPLLAEKASRKLQRMHALPDPDLREKVRAALEHAAIVHRPRRTPRGELHKQMPEIDATKGMPKGQPWDSAIVGKYMVKFDHDGNPAQAYPLGNNHHVVIWERTTPNAKGAYERIAEVVPTIEAVRRRDKREPVIRKNPTEMGWKFVMALCKGDMVEMANGTVGVVSKFSGKATAGDAEIAVWMPYAAQQLGGFNAANPYVIARIQTKARLSELRSRIVENAYGEIVYREGHEE